MYTQSPPAPSLVKTRRKATSLLELLCIPPNLQAGEGGELQMGYRDDMKLIQQWTDVQVPPE